MWTWGTCWEASKLIANPLIARRKKFSTQDSCPVACISFRRVARRSRFLRRDTSVSQMSTLNSLMIFFLFKSFFQKRNTRLSDKRLWASLSFWDFRNSIFYYYYSYRSIFVTFVDLPVMGVHMYVCINFLTYIILI